MAELSTIARPYAQALFAVADQEGASLESWGKRLAQLARLTEDTEVRAALSDPRHDTQQRIDLFFALLNEPLPDEAASFLRLLIENNRILLLPQIADAFEELRHKHEGTALAEITSAFPLSDGQLRSLMAGLEKKFGLKLEPSVTVDAALIGGIRITVGDQVLDTSVQAQLARMRDSLVA